MKWICTDSACNQFGRKLGNKRYEFKQDVTYPDNLVICVENEIDLNDYSDDEINDHLSPYGWCICDLMNENTADSAEWLMAECIFEQTIFN